MRTLTLLQPRRLVVGRGCTADALAYLGALRPAHLRIIGSASMADPAEKMAQALRAEEIAVTVDAGVTSEPTVAVFERALVDARTAGTTCVLALGGGSVLDVAKLVAALLTSDQPLEDAFGIGRLHRRACHLFCMPSTAGTGSEVSPNAILLDEAKAAKRAVISEHLVPDATFIDPELARTLPPPMTAATGLDALAHCLEAYTNKFAHPAVDLFALEGIRLCGRFLERAVHNPDDMEAREGMAYASLYGGLCLGPVNTAAAHALAYPLGSRWGIPHGISVALLLPHVFAFNAEAFPERHGEALLALCGRSAAYSPAMEGARAIRELAAKCGLSLDLEAYGVRAESVPELAAAAMEVTRLLQNNPRPLVLRDCVQIYHACFQS